MPERALYTDRDIATLLGVSLSWVRVQRHNRRHGKPHDFPWDARRFGSCVRYVRAEVHAFIKLIEDGENLK